MRRLLALAACAAALGPFAPAASGADAPRWSEGDCTPRFCPGRAASGSGAAGFTAAVLAAVALGRRHRARA